MWRSDWGWPIGMPSFDHLGEPWIGRINPLGQDQDEIEVAADGEFPAAVSPDSDQARIPRRRTA